jgi:hypothetical protein
MFGILRLKRRVGGTGYKYVYKSKSETNPFQAMIFMKHLGRQRSLGHFATAKEAAIKVATTLSLGDDDDLPSPRKQQKRGALPLTARHHPHACSAI